jgi:hypothetical protein
LDKTYSAKNKIAVIENTHVKEKKRKKICLSNANAAAGNKV